jgi:23S rRNA (uridine2479-2'-O)-methyltransferase
MSGGTVRGRDARFQQWQALLTNRTKRHRAGQFLVQGVRPITLAVRHGARLVTLLRPAGGRLSTWAAGIAAGSGAEVVEVAPELLAELGEKTDGAPELVAVAALPPDRLDRLAAGPDLLAVVFDRPTSPGNIGTLIRSADAFGATGVVVTGHAADPYDPKSVRASTGSLFAVPVVRTAPADVLAWLAALRSGGLPVRLAGADESGTTEIGAADLTGPCVLVVGNETTGLSAAWREACDELVRIPIGGAASSLNAAVAGSLALYEAATQRRAGRR